MKHRYTAIALPIIVCGAAVAGATNASARDIEPERDGTPPVVIPGPVVEVPVDDSVAEGLQTAAGVLGGAGLAIGGLWMYRRRQPLAAH
ncbi:hypothetical protein [Kribbella speibonae]|uniref:LPXTG cell wall anchor domain-containing protein n=1 Tax=Kribbella speibonae TaxID=1572660 RepID=A0A4R0J8J3_9ACTN|nr:hypothetical protein [Kribbella speibonae]TCC37755.1 hypothetical protein E0H92_14805 [Kribbella speibonae]